MADNDVVFASAIVTSPTPGLPMRLDPVSATSVAAWQTATVAQPVAPVYPDSSLALGPVSVYPTSPAQDASGLTLTYTAQTTMPPTLTVSPTTGEISGTLTYRGLAHATARVRVGNGYVDTLTAPFTLYIPDIVDVNQASAALLTPLYVLPESDTLRLNDYSPTPKTITASGGSWSTVAPKFYGGAMFFNGATFLTTSTSADFTYGTGTFTAELWFYTPSVDATYKTLLSGNRYATGQSGGLGVYLYGTEIRLWKTIGGAGTNILNVGTIAANTWTHLALSRSSAGRLAVFIDGVLRGTVNDTTAGADTAYNIGRDSGVTYFNGYLQDVRIYKNLDKYPTTFTTQTQAFPDSVAGGDASFASVTTLLHGDGANGSTLITDNASAFTPAGYFDSSGDSLAYANPAALTLAAGDFTVETWVFFNSLNAANNIIFDGRPTSTSGAYPTLYATATSLRWYTSSADRVTGSFTWTPGTWYHVAAVRSSGSTRLYVNGAQVGSAFTDATNYINGAGRPTIGGHGFNTATAGLDGYLRDFRVTKGVARYTGPFTPPSTPLPTGGDDPSWASVSLLLPMATDFTDVSANALAATVNGDAKIATNAVPYGGAQISTAQSRFGGAAMSFNGASSRIQLGRAGDPVYNIGTADFTIECWIYPTVAAGTSANGGIYSAWNGGAANAFLLYIQSGTGNSRITFYTQAQTTLLQSTNPVTLNAWTHVAVCRSSGSTRMYINGVLESTSTASYTMTPSAAAPVTVGAYWQASAVEGTSYFNGFIDELRVTKGVARYTGNFTPPGQLLVP